MIDLVYALKRPYRKNAAFILNDKLIAKIRKLKYADGKEYIWQPTFVDGEPDRIRGYPVYTSAFAPEDKIAFGDFSYYNIGYADGKEYIWQPTFVDGEPDRIRGYPVYTSAFAPEDKIAFGDFSYYNIGDRGKYIWQPTFVEGEPDRIMGYPVYTSAYAPEDKIAVGDFSYYNIGDRGSLSFSEQRELFAGNGMVGFVAKELVDGKLVLP